jgi:DNA-directed RNA polymerase subunit K
MMWEIDRLTRFEVARLIGARSLQIALGAPILVDALEKTASIDIALAEFKAKMIPISVKRELPNKQKFIVEIKKAIANWLEDHAGEV